jgi:dolichyl-phosphate-mannose--protein O-mannosyl transferase
MGMAQDSSSNSTLTYANSRDARTAGSRRWYYLLVVFVLAALPRLWQLDYFLMVDENLWYQRSAHFLQGLVSGNLAQTVQSGHPGVTAMWSGAIGLLLHYAQSALPGETLVQFAARMTTTPATLATLQLLRLPLALLSALVVVLAFGLGRRLLGTGAALAGAALMAFEPLYLAHCRVLHHDSPAAGFSLLAVLGWLLYLKERRHRYLLLAGLGIGLAVLSKVSSVFLLGFAGLTLLPVAWRERRQWLSAVRAVAVPWLKLAGIVCLVMVLVWPALWAHRLRLHRTREGGARQWHLFHGAACA